MKTKTFKRGFTLAELLTAIVIITILLGILLPALNMARNFAKDTSQKVQNNSIDVGINMYKNDFGDYPPSHGYNSGNPLTYADYDYCGAQTLTEALLGYDLLGFHKNSVFRENGQDKNNNHIYPQPADPPPDKANLDARKLYMKRENVGIFTAKNIFGSRFINNGLTDRYLICDTFTSVYREIDFNGNKQGFKVGTPILYFRANTDGVKLVKDDSSSIYVFWDNQFLVEQGRVSDGKPHEGFMTPAGDADEFYERITDIIKSPTPANPWPVCMDSFLLISAGRDGLYGTADDICNFEPYFVE
jgi:prepilin-type N-terminal cleavage/methylation domain-containing protein